MGYSIGNSVNEPHSAPKLQMEVAELRQAGAARGNC
jgi:hypothetical protein